MTYGIFIEIFTNNPTLHGELSKLLPDAQDARVDKIDKVWVGDNGFGRDIFSARIRCKTELDCKNIVNNLTALAEKHRELIEEGSGVYVHYSYHDENNEKPCSLIPYWLY